MFLCFVSFFHLERYMMTRIYKEPFISTLQPGPLRTRNSPFQGILSQLDLEKCYRSQYYSERPRNYKTCQKKCTSYSTNMLMSLETGPS